MWLIDSLRTVVRAVMRRIARGLHRLSGGRLHPDVVTLVGFLAHMPTALLIALGHTVWGAIFLIIFGLFDTLDGELARLQGRASTHGMLLDATTDRFKEVFLYIGVAYNVALSRHPTAAAWATAACGASICVSYVKAKGEAVAAAGGSRIPHAVLNRMFKDGLLTFEVRMVVLIVGLLSGQLMIAMIIIALLAGYTALWRLMSISRRV